MVLLLFSSCSFYSISRSITVSNLSWGKLVVSSDNYYKEYSVYGDFTLDGLDKGETYYMSFYPLFLGEYSRFPLGSIASPGCYSLSLEYKPGLLTSSVNTLHREGLDVNDTLFYSLFEIISDEIDPWIYRKEDILMALNGEIGCNSIKKEEILNIPELDHLFNLRCENPLQLFWYETILSFYNERGESVRLEIYSRDEYILINQ